MKALISPNELFTHTWIISWKQEDEKWVPDTIGLIENYQRVAEVKPNSAIFDVALPLHWVDCPDECVADLWYYKDGQVQAKPQDVPVPEGE